MTSGAAPPIQNSTRQPYSPTSLAATKPGSPPPNVTPMKIRTTSVARRRCGANSLFSVTTIGSVPPSATPANIRAAIISPRLAASTAAKVKTPNA